MSARHHQPASGKFRDKQLGRGVSKDYRHYLEVLESRQLLSATLIGTFNTPVTAGTVGMVVGDFNGDGKLDVATDNTSVAHVDVMLGHGDGTFSQPVSYFDGAQGPSGLIVGDFTGDGKLDLGVEGGDISTFAPVIHILTGNGDGTFNAVNAFPEPMTAQLGNYGSPVAVDVNGDGKADLVTTNPSLGTVGIMLSNGDGTFQFNVAYAAVTNAVSVASGDFNHDGKIDLAVNGNGVAILLGKGDGTFAAPQAVTSALSSFPIAAGDINADGNLDLLVGNTIWLGNGDGTFQESATQLSSGANLSLVDLNGDGAADVITNSTAGEIGVQINNGDGTFAGEVDYADQATNFFSVGDFNGDGRVDLAGFNAATSQLNIIPGNGDGTLQAATIFGSGDTNNPVAGLKLSPSNPSQFLADFNGDGIQDMAVSNPAADKISISLGNADGTFQPALTFVPPNVGTQPHPQIVSAGDFDGDGKADLIIYNPGLPEQVILGGGETHAPTRIIPGTSATWTLFLSNGDGSFRASTVSNALFAPSLAVITTQADIDGDGTPDIISTFNTVTAPASKDVGVMTIQLSYIGDKLRQQTFTVGGKPNAILVTDLNADGIPDIALSGGSSNQVWVLINNGDGTFQPIAGYTAYTPAQGSPFDANGNFAIKAADFNRDGIVDLAVTTKLGQVSILHGNGDGTFQTGQSFDIGGTAQVIGIGDFNGDGFPDIAAPVGLQTSVAINTEGEMLGDAVGFRVSPSASSVAGQATSVTITAIDASGNAVPDFRGTVHVTSSDPHATLPKFYTFSAADAGVHTFTNQVTLDKAGVDVITASNPRLASASGTINVTAGAAAGFSVAMPTQAVAGTPFNAVVSAVDQFGNVAPTYTGTVDFNSNDPRATLPASYVFSTADAGTHTFSMTLIQAMAYHPAGFSVLQPGILFPADGPMVTVSDDAHAALTGANGVTVNAGAMSRLAVIAIPATVSHTAIAGEAINVIANAFDVYGNIAAFPTGDVIHVSVSDPKAELPGDQTIVPPTPQFPSSNTTVEWANSTANAVYMTTAGNQTITVTDLTHPAVFGSTPITVFGATASSLAISFPSSAAAGTPTAMTVTALDQFGNTAGGYGGIIRFTSSDAAASLPADYAFTSADNGSHTFTVTLKTLGSQTISVVDFFNFNPALAASKMIMVNPGPAAVVAVTPIASTIAGVAQSFSVSLQDIAGDLLHNYTGTVQFSSTDVQAGLPASYTFSAADAGTHVFSATLKTAGTQSIRVQDSANPGLSGTIANIVVTSAAATHFVMTPPASAISGKSFTMTVAAVDAFGNVVTGYRGKVHMTDSVNAGLPSDYTFSASDAGVHTFSVTLSTVGSQILKLTDTTNSLLTGSVAILVSAPATGGGATGGGGGGAAGGGGGAAGGGGGGSGGGGGKAA